MLKTFAKGGVHPPEYKISANQAIKVLAVPDKVAVPISQHIGAPAVPAVKKKDIVKVGQVIAKSGGFVSANIHSPVSGVVEKIDVVTDSSGYKRTAVFIAVDGDDWEESIDRSTTLLTEIKATKEEIVQKVLDAGIVGLGGATFPSHVKLSVPKGKSAEVLIINGVECEPYLTADHRLMLEKGDEIMVGVQILMKGLDVKRAIIGIENNKKDAIEHLQKISSKYPGIEICRLKVKYPQGGEKQLIKATIKREVPSGGLPIDVGAVVNNVGTAYAVYEAIQKNKPLIERVVTVTGNHVGTPSNFMCRIGTMLSEIVAAAGGVPENTGKIISGGPMMGRSLAHLNTPMAKGTSGILLIEKTEAKRGTMQKCIRCAKCVSVCPMGLEPFLLMTLADRNRIEDVQQNRALDCIECGSCSFTCPSSRPLLDYIRLGKTSVTKMLRAQNQK